MDRLVGSACFTLPKTRAILQASVSALLAALEQAMAESAAAAN